jgi:integrase
MTTKRGLFQRDDDWWIRYADGTGKIRREKAGTLANAKRLYMLRKAAVLEGRKLPNNLRVVVRVSDLVPTLRGDYRDKGHKSYAWVERRLRLHILPSFGELAVDDVTTDHIRAYIDDREDEGATAATINRELAALKRMYNLGRAATPPKVRWVPVMPRLKESEPRAGFVEDNDYQSLIAHTDELWLRAMLAAAYTFGFRLGELLSLRVGQINLAERAIVLEARSTKNKKARKVIMTTEVYELISALIAHKHAADFVFTRESSAGNGEHGSNQVRDFRGAWWALCEKAGLGNWVKCEDEKSRWQGLLFHDLRRSAVRNMVRAGISEKVAMAISGHKTRSVFDRYNIVDDADLRRAAERIEGKSKARTDTKTDTKTSTEPKGALAEERPTADKIEYLQ